MASGTCKTTIGEKKSKSSKGQDKTIMQSPEDTDVMEWNQVFQLKKHSKETETEFLSKDQRSQIQ